MGFIVRDCIRCPTKQVQMIAQGWVETDNINAEIFFVCQACGQGSIYWGQPDRDPVTFNGNIEKDRGRSFGGQPILAFPSDIHLSEHIPERVRDLFQQAHRSRKTGLNDASGSMFRKTIDVATKGIFSTDARLAEKIPADAPRARIKALAQFGIIDNEIFELADVALVDGNDAAHDADPYTAEEAEALEDLTFDLLERIFVRPARVAAVKAKQVLAGQRK
ncbi:DUF4145 domain-containing protein [Rhizobium rhizogenes]